MIVSDFCSQIRCRDYSYEEIAGKWIKFLCDLVVHDCDDGEWRHSNEGGDDRQWLGHG